MAGRVAGGVVNSHFTSSSSNLESSVGHNIESAAWGKEKAAMSVLDTV